MAYDEHHDPEHTGGLYASSTADTPLRSARRRRQVVVGVAGAAAVLAGAGFLVTQFMNEQQPGLPEPNAMAPLTVPNTKGSGSTPDQAVAPLTPTPRVMKKAAPVERSPLPPPPESPVASPVATAQSAAALSELRERLGLGGPRTEIRERVESLGTGTIRVVSARRDLTALLTDGDGAAVGGGVRCTTGLPDDEAMRSAEPAVLVCWRTSAERSVITMSSSPRATADSIEVITREWARLE